jgi:hypothetical protein
VPSIAAICSGNSNPINYVTADDPPFLIIQGLLDCLTLAPERDVVRGTPREGRNGEALPIVSDFFDQYLRGTLPVRRRAVRIMWGRASARLAPGRHR